MKIISVVGARPNFMKVAPLHRVFSVDPNIDSIIVHTGQHYDERMSQVFFDQLGLPKPDYYLGIGGGSHTEQTAKIMLAFDEVLEEEDPDLVIVVGDVNSTVACTLTAVKKNIKVAHVEAGLRSGDRQMPEEINRLVTDSISDLLFVSEESGVKNLQAEGVDPSRIHFVGNVMIDSLVHFLPKSESLTIEKILSENKLPPATCPQPPAHCLMTMHRPSNVDHAEGLEKIIKIINELSRRVSIVFAVHPRTEKNLKKFALWNQLANIPNVILTAPLGYLEFVKLMQSAKLVVTDSGGIQEETTYLQVPCITFRDSTERPSTVDIGSNTLMKDLDIKRVLSLAHQVLDGHHKKGRIPDKWDGKAAERIKDILVVLPADGGARGGMKDIGSQ